MCVCRVQEGVSASQTFKSLKGLIDWCLVMVLVLRVVTYMHVNDLFSKAFNEFCRS